MRINKLLKRISDFTDIEVINQRANIIYKGQKCSFIVDENFKVGRIEARGSGIYIFERSDIDAKKQILKPQQNRHIQNINLDG